MVQSQKGKGGGYFLRREPADITFGEVIRVLDGPLAAVPCVSQTAYMKCVECVDEPTCGVRLAMKEVRDATAQILDHTTLADVNARAARVARKRTNPHDPFVPARHRFVSRVIDLLLSMRMYGAGDVPARRRRIP